MAELIIPEPLASRIRQLAQETNREPLDVIEYMLKNVQIKPRRSPPPPDIPEYPPRPASSLTDDDIDLPLDVTDPVEKEKYRAAAREMAPKRYEIAREYWQEVGDTEKLALTDEYLDKHFWLIDHEGVPRFKHEKGTIVLPPNPLEALVGLFADSEVTDASVSVRETMAKKYGIRTD
jgi:hypothetical protein